MARKSAVRGTLTSRAQVSALASPIRQEIVDTLENLGGMAAVAQIAEQLGRPADGLYFHLRRLVRSGVLEELPDEGNGRTYRTIAAPGHLLTLSYRDGAKRDFIGLTRVVGSLLRMAKRDFAAALRRPDTVVEGKRRELWAARSKGWVTVEELAEINRLLARLNEVMHRPRTAQRNQLMSLAYVLAPVAIRPLRRDSRF